MRWCVSTFIVMLTICMWCFVRGSTNLLAAWRAQTFHIFSPEDHPSILIYTQKEMLLNAFRCDFGQGLYVQDHLKNQGVEIKLPLGFLMHLISTYFDL